MGGMKENANGRMIQLLSMGNRRNFSTEIIGKLTTLMLKESVVGICGILEYFRGGCGRLTEIKMAAKN